MKTLLSMIAILFVLSAQYAFSETPQVLSKETPIIFDKSAGTVSFLAEVNGKYFYQPTRHFAVSATGSNGDKAILRGLVPPPIFTEPLRK